jgi:hypothetical protein
MKPFDWTRETGRKHGKSSLIPVEQRGTTMLILILNAIYRQFLRDTLPGITLLGTKR